MELFDIIIGIVVQVHQSRFIYLDLQSESYGFLSDFLP